MPKKKPRVRRSRDEVRELLAEFRAGGLPASRFADRIGVNVNTVYQWAREAGAPSAPAASQRVVPVRVVSDTISVASPVDIEIGLRNGRTVRLRHAVDTHPANPEHIIGPDSH